MLVGSEGRREHTLTVRLETILSRVLNSLADRNVSVCLLLIWTKLMAFGSGSQTVVR
jgi:hypothetical protein